MIVSSPWNKVQVYFSGDDYFASVVRAIDNAQSEVLLESYIFNMDPIGVRVLDALSRARKRGLRVQILVDGVGSFNWAPQLEKYCKLHSLNFRIFHPIPLRDLTLKNFSWKKIRRYLLLLKKINRRNHRKFILIDRSRCFLGSLNISQVHTREFLSQSAWRDTAVYVEGGSLESLRWAFFHAWYTAKLRKSFFKGTLSKLKSRTSTQSPLRLNTTAYWRFRHLRDLNKRIKSAKDQVWITNAYFVPRRSILKSLRKKAATGVDVALCLPAQSDVWFVRWAAKSLYLRLLKAGVRVFEYQPSMLHAKTMIIDQWATVGSHNLNHRSLLHDLEVEAVVEDTEVLKQLQTQWLHDIGSSREVTLSEMQSMTIWERSLARFTYWFRYWI